jgi:hypothetical protein
MCPAGVVGEREVAEQLDDQQVAGPGDVGGRGVLGDGGDDQVRRRGVPEAGRRAVPRHVDERPAGGEHRALDDGA